MAVVPIGTAEKNEIENLKILMVEMAIGKAMKWKDGSAIVLQGVEES